MPTSERPDQRPSELNAHEQRAIRSLQRLARSWPKSLLLASMDGELVVFRTGDSSRVGEDGALNPDAAVAEIEGIPNTGGAW